MGLKNEKRAFFHGVGWRRRRSILIFVAESQAIVFVVSLLTVPTLECFVLIWFILGTAEIP